jgi:hypothetical protein
MQEPRVGLDHKRWHGNINYGYINDPDGGVKDGGDTVW